MVLSQEGNKLKLEGRYTRYYNLDDLGFSHNNVTLEIWVNDKTKESISYSEITSPASTSLDNLVEILNGYTSDVNVTVTNSTDVSNVEDNTYLTHKYLMSLIELQKETNDLLKLILS